MLAGGVFWTSYVRSIYILCPGISLYFFTIRHFYNSVLAEISRKR